MQIFIDDVRSSIEKILVEKKFKTQLQWIEKLSQSKTHKLKFGYLLLITQVHLKTLTR